MTQNYTFLIINQYPSGSIGVQALFNEDFTVDPEIDSYMKNIEQTVDDRVLERVCSYACKSRK